MEKASYILWVIWARRNYFVWQGKLRSSIQVDRHGVEFLTEWIMENPSVATRLHREGRLMDGSNAMLMMLCSNQEIS